MLVNVSTVFESALRSVCICAASLLWSPCVALWCAQLCAASTAACCGCCGSSPCVSCPWASPPAAALSTCTRPILRCCAGRLAARVFAAISAATQRPRQRRRDRIWSPIRRSTHAPMYAHGVAYCPEPVQVGLSLVILQISPQAGNRPCTRLRSRHCSSAQDLFCGYQNTVNPAQNGPSCRFDADGNFVSSGTSIARAPQLQ